MRTQTSTSKKLNIVHRSNGVHLVCDRGDVAKLTAGYALTQEADAIRLWRCVNTFDDLVAALKLARRKIELWPGEINPEYFPEIKAIDAALALAEQGGE